VHQIFVVDMSRKSMVGALGVYKYIVKKNGTIKLKLRVIVRLKLINLEKYAKEF
jgi:hypothetical protein